MTNDFERIAGVTTSRNAPKSTLKKDKLQPFGAHYVTRLSGVNSKLVCSLSRNALTDVVSDPCPPCDNQY